jgi:hypothetical protein
VIIKTYIASEYPQATYPCQYNALLAHEKEHQRHLDTALRSLQQNLYSRIRAEMNLPTMEKPVYVATTQEARARAEAALKSFIRETSVRWRDLTLKEEQVFDDESRAGLNSACNGSWPF